MAVLKLGDEHRRLLLDSGYSGAIDLRYYQAIGGSWFAGRDVYGKLHSPYPPGSMPLLKVLGFGWFGETDARWLWAFSLAGVTCVFGWLMVKESRAESNLDKLFVVLMLLSMNATGVNVGNGQISLHVLLLMTAPILFLDRHAEWRRQTPLVLTALLISLVKPSMSVPFFGLVLVQRNGFRTAAAVAVGYAAVTMFAVAFQDRPLLALLRDSLAYGHAQAVPGGYANLDNWLLAMGLPGWAFPAAFLVLVTLGLWLLLHRHADVWILLGVTAITARLWMYHRVYDDMLILLPMVALFRIARHPNTAQEASVQAGLLLAVTVVAMLAPARFERLPFPWHVPFTVGHAVIWIVIGAFLIRQARMPAVDATLQAQPWETKGDRITLC
jgi:hypothetical protein